MNRPDEIAALADEIAAVRLDQSHDKWPTVLLRLSETQRELLVSSLRLSATPPGDAVRVKPLVWDRFNDDRTIHIATALPGEYWAWELAGLGYWSWGSLVGREVHGGIEGAKAAAQADYEQRTLAALATAEKAGPPDELTRENIRTRAAKMLTAKGWTPGSNISLHSAMELLTAFGMDLARKPETDRCNYPECGCDVDEVCNEGLKHVIAATPTPPSADVEDETKCECGFLASACRTNPCYRKKTATSGLVPNAKYPDLGHLPATRAVSEIDAGQIDTKNKIIALIRDGFDPEPNDWPRHRGWDDGAGEIAEKIIAVFQHSGGETTQTVETCPRCNLKADSLLHKFCTHSQCPIRSSLIQSAAHGGGTKSDGGVEGHAAVPPEIPAQRSGESRDPLGDGSVKVGPHREDAAGIKSGPSDPAQEPQAVGPLREARPSIPEDGFNCIWLMENGHQVGCLDGAQNEPAVIARAQHWSRPVSLGRLTESNISDEICYVFGCRSTCVSECNSEINKDKCGEAARRVLALIEGRT